MTTESILLKSLLFSIPTLGFFATVCYAVNRWCSVQQHKLKQQAVQQQRGKAAVAFNEKLRAMQLEAYQRLVLFLERISPQHIAMRLVRSKMSADELQHQLLATIRQEYEHNLAQQLFVSSKAWESVKSSKEEVVKVINMAASRLAAGSTATDLSRGIVEITAQLKHQPTDQALLLLNREGKDRLGEM